MEKTVSFFFKILFIYFQRQGREGQREGEKHQCVFVSRCPQLGAWPTTQACGLTENQTSDTLVHRPALNPLSHTSQGSQSSFCYIRPFNISYNSGLVMMNSFRFTLSGKHFICPSILNDSFAGKSNLGCRSLFFITSNTSCQPFPACKVSFEKSADSLTGTLL